MPQEPHGYELSELNQANRFEGIQLLRRHADDEVLQRDYGDLIYAVAERHPGLRDITAEPNNQILPYVVHRIGEKRLVGMAALHLSQEEVLTPFGEQRPFKGANLSMWLEPHFRYPNLGFTVAKRLLEKLTVLGNLTHFWQDAEPWLRLPSDNTKGIEFCKSLGFSAAGTLVGHRNEVIYMRNQG